MLEPPREPRGPAAGAARDGADIARLGYTISVERAAGVFDGIRQAMRVGLRLDDANRALPDPAQAARPLMLWQALGLAFEPGRFMPAAVALLAAQSTAWAMHGAGVLAGPAGAALAAVSVAIAAATGAVGAAAATHEMLMGGTRLSVRDGLRALAGQAGALVGAAREAAARVGVGVLLVATAAMLAALGDRPSPAVAAVARVTSPLQVLLVVAALAVAADAAYRVLAYAAVAAGPPGRLAVQAALEARRIGGERTLVPTRALAPAFAGAVALAVVLGSAGHLVLAAWDAATADLGVLPAAGRAIGRDAVWALLGGIWCSYAGVAGLMAGYALGTGTAQGPVRAPEIITGTYGAGLQVVAQAKAPTKPTTKATTTTSDDPTGAAPADQPDQPDEGRGV